nr:dispanin subfamily A member 2b-like [Pogona vitticeps]
MEAGQVKVAAFYPYPYPAPIPGPAPPPAVVHVRQPRDYVVWSLLSTFYMNFCFLGFAALVFSIKSRDCKVMGDPEGASRNGIRAKYLNLAALTMGIVFLIVSITMIATGVSLLHRQLQKVIGDFHESNMEP